jgi:hypothetical protein
MSLPVGRNIQKWLGLPDDGLWGPATQRAARAKLEQPEWTRNQLIIGCQQMMMKEAGLDISTIDGKAGPEFRAAQEKWQNGQIADSFKTSDEDAEDHPVKNNWPRQSDVPDFYGRVGENQIMVDLPYTLKIAWDTDKTVKRMSLHKKVGASAVRVLKAVLEHYGKDELEKLGLTLWGGSLNVRKMRGGNSYSMHSWGIAIDWDPDRNEMRMDHTKARFAKEEYEFWWDAWEAEGWVSLGRARDFDWMHVQAARL